MKALSSFVKLIVKKFIGNKKSQLRYIYYNLFLYIAILLSITLNVLYFNSIILGCILFLSYLIFFGYITGKIFFSQEDFSLLMGIFLILCWLTIWEGIIATFKKFIVPWIFLPIVLYPLFLLIFQWKNKRELSSLHFYIILPKIDFIKNQKGKIIFILLIINCLFSYYYLFISRTSSMIFSANEVLPIYFWLFFTISLSLFAYLYRSVEKNKEIFMLIISFIISFLHFGIIYIIYKYSFGTDTFGLISSFRVVFYEGGRGLRIVFFEMGLHGLIDSIVAIMTLQPETKLIYVVFRLFVPLIASIYIPFFTYKFLRLFIPSEKIFYLGTFSFMLFPSLWSLGNSVAMNVGDIFLFSLLYFITRFFNSSKHKFSYISHVVPIILTFFAILLLHQIVALYALLSVLSALFFHMLRTKSRKYYAIATMGLSLIIAIIIIPLFFTDVIAKLVPNYIGWLNSSATFSIPSLSDITAFFFPQIYPFNQTIIEEQYNWFRYIIFIVGSRHLMKNRKIFSKVGAMWLIILVINIWFSWFVLVTCLEGFVYGGHRFAKILDLALIPFAGVALYKICKSRFHSVDISMRIWKFKTRFPSIIIILLLLSSLCTCSSYIGFLSPLFPKDNIPAIPGRPIWRAVSEAEVKAVNYINATSKGMKYVVITDGFLKKLVTGMLGYETYPGLDRIYPGLGLWSVETRYLHEMLNNPINYPTRSVMFRFMGLANVSVGYYLVGDYQIKQRYGDSKEYTAYVEQLKRISDSWAVFTDERYNYSVYVFKFNYYTILPVNTKLKGFKQTIVYDRQPDFWNVQVWGKGKGNINILSYSENNGIVCITIDNGTYSGVGLTHTYNQIEYTSQPEAVISYWTFDEGLGRLVHDSYGNNDGMVHGAQWCEGKHGKALSFDGIDDYVEISDSPSLNPENITLEAWIKLSSLNKNQNIMAKNSKSVADASWRFFVTKKNKLRLVINTRPEQRGWDFLDSNTELTTNVWYHVIGTYDGATMKIYINGTLNAMKTHKTGGPIFPSAYPILIGGKAMSLDYFNGVIDEVRIYRHPLRSEKDWSSYNFIALCIYGTGSFLPIWVDIDAPNHDSYFRYELIDNFLGWKLILIPLNKPTEVIDRAGTPDFSRVKKIWICFTSPGTYCIDRVILLTRIQDIPIKPD